MFTSSPIFSLAFDSLQRHIEGYNETTSTSNPLNNHKKIVNRDGLEPFCCYLILEINWGSPLAVHNSLAVSPDHCL